MKESGGVGLRQCLEEPGGLGLLRLWHLERLSTACPPSFFDDDDLGRLSSSSPHHCPLSSSSFSFSFPFLTPSLSRSFSTSVYALFCPSFPLFPSPSFPIYLLSLSSLFPLLLLLPSSASRHKNHSVSRDNLSSWLGYNLLPAVY